MPIFHLAAKNEIEKHLKPGEKLLWSGVQCAAREINSRNKWVLGICAFFLLPTAFVIQYAVSDGQYSPSDGVTKFLVVVGVVGLLVALTLWQSRLIGRTFYAVTNERAIILTTGPGGGIVSLRGDDINLLKLDHPKAGLSNLALRYEPGVEDIGFVGFSSIQDGELVKDLVEKHLLAGKTRHKLGVFTTLPDKIDGYFA